VGDSPLPIVSVRAELPQPSVEDGHVAGDGQLEARAPVLEGALGLPVPETAACERGCMEGAREERKKELTASIFQRQTRRRLPVGLETEGGRPQRLIRTPG
jgi:hypothetical protein